jgi:LysM repeat protein
VPTERLFEEASSASSAGPSVNAEETVIEYKVGSKETLYAIAKRFNMSIDDIKRLNNLTGNALSIGQVLKVKTSNTITTSGTSQPPAAPATGVNNTPAAAGRTAGNTNATTPGSTNTSPTTVKTAPPGPAVTPPSKPAVVNVAVAATRDSTVPDTSSLPHDRKLHANKFGLREVSEKGVAVWMEDENVDATKMLILHKTAPVGTVIKITNPMTDRSTFAKVVGRFTENENNRDAIIVVTKATATLLGALDKRFQVSLIYGVPNTTNE